METITLPENSLYPNETLTLNVERPILDNEEIQINLSNLNFINKVIIPPYSWEKEEINKYDITNIIIDWDDDINDSYNIPLFELNDTEIILKNSSWYKNICKHTYTDGKAVTKQIKLTITDSIDNVYQIVIKVELILNSLANLNIEFDITKANYNSSSSTVMMKINDNSGNFEYTDIPVIAVLT